MDWIVRLCYLLPFTVLNRRAQIKCPFCGRTNTARILYGMPLFNDEMQKKLDSGKLRLGGCVISTAEDGNGNRVWIGPERFCNNCRREFARPAYLLSKDRKSAEAYRDIVTGIRFSTWAEREPDDRTEIILKKNTEGAVLSASKCRWDKEPVMIEGRQITEARWLRLLDRLYSDLHLHEWKHHSEDNFHDFFVLDGEEFELEITLTNGRKRRYDGNVEYLPYWPELKALFRPLLKA